LPFNQLDLNQSFQPLTDSGGGHIQPLSQLLDRGTLMLAQQVQDCLVDGADVVRTGVFHVLHSRVF
jgi:hypothetical protein